MFKAEAVIYRKDKFNVNEFTYLFYNNITGVTWLLDYHNSDLLANVSAWKHGQKTGKLGRVKKISS